MGSHHDHDHHVTENKPVSFITPLILGLVTILIIVLSVNACDRKKEGCCEGDEKCEMKCDDKHGANHEMKEEGHHEAAAVVTETIATADSTLISTDTAKVHTEATSHEEAHHAETHH